MGGNDGTDFVDGLQTFLDVLNQSVTTSRLRRPHTVVNFLSHCTSGSRLQNTNGSDGRPPNENLFGLSASEWECASIEKMRCGSHGEGAPA